MALQPQFSDLDTPTLRVGLRCAPQPGDSHCEHGASLHRAIAVIYAATVTISDEVAPTAGAVTGSITSGGWLKGTKTVAGSGSDSTGVSRLDLMDGSTPIRTDDQECDFTYPAPCANPGGLVSSDWTSLNTALLADGTHTLRTRSRDAAGNTTLGEQLVVQVDNTAPAAPVGLAAAGGTGWGSEASRSLDWSTPPGQAAPIESATVTLCPAGGGECSSTPADSLTATTVSLPSPGVWSIGVHLTDEAGNVDGANKATTTLRFDPDAPPAPALGSIQQAPGAINSFNVQVSFADGGPAPLAPPLGEVCRSDGTDCTAVPEQSPGDRIYFSAPAAGTWLLRAYGRDEAGNVGAKATAAFTYAPPTPTPTPSATPTPTASAAPTPTIEPTPPPAVLPRRRPLLTITSARMTATRLRVRGRLSRAATQRVELTFKARHNGRSARVERRLRARAGRIAITVRLPRSLRSSRRGRVALRFRGDTRHLPRAVGRTVRR